MNATNQFLALSLFIMLLAFFIILNSLSNYEDVKSRPVLNSLATAFANKSPDEPMAPNAVESEQKSIAEGDTLDKLQTLFSAHITAAEVSKNRLGTKMHIRLPLRQFESSLLAPSRNNIRNARLGAPGTFTPTLLSLMQTRETEIPYRMDMVLNTQEKPATAIVDTPEQIRADMQKVSTLAKRLQDSGLEKKLLSAGVTKGEVGMIDLYFTRYVPVNPVTENGN